MVSASGEGESDSHGRGKVTESHGERERRLGYSLGGRENRTEADLETPSWRFDRVTLAKRGLPLQICEFPGRFGQYGHNDKLNIFVVGID